YARGMIGGELENAVAKPDVLGALAGGGEERFRRWRMRIFFQEMMLHDPGVVVAEPVGGLELRQRVLVELELVALLPWARQLQLVKDTEFHDVSLGPLVVLTECIPGRVRVQPQANSAGREAGLRW